MAKIFVTGATGQVGSHFVQYLVENLNNRPLGIERPGDIRCLVRERGIQVEKVAVKKAGSLRDPDAAAQSGASEQEISPSFGIPSGRSRQLLKNLKVEIFKGDLSDSRILKEALADINYVFHFAANVYVYSSFEDMYKANVEGTKNLLNAFVDSNADLFVYTSSIIVYDTSHKAFKLCSRVEGDRGNSERIFDFKEDCPWGPVIRNKDIPYAVTKRLAESLVREYAERYGNKLFLITRLGPVVGSRDRQMIPALVESMKISLPKLVGGGKTRISLTAPQDIARAQVFLSKNILSSRIESGDVFNVANELVSFKELFSYVARYYNRKPPSFSIPRWIFRLVKPFLKLAKRFVPNNMFIQTFFSPSALEYLEKSYSYNSEKLKSLGFQFKIPIRDSVLEGLKELDPYRRMVN